MERLDAPCTNCGAPVSFNREETHDVRCAYCGVMHRRAKDARDENQLVRGEQRVGSIIGPYIAAPLLGALAFWALRDFVGSAYEGIPSVGMSIIFLIIGFTGMRMVAAVGLAGFGLFGMLKPFVFPIPSTYLGYYSPTSETSLYYILPGLISTVVGALFVASLRIRDFKPALRALRPRPTILLAFILGVAAARFVTGPTIHSVVLENASAIESLSTLATNACQGKLKSTPEAAFSTAPRYRQNKPSNTLFASCAAVFEPGERDTDPLYIGYLDRYIGYLKEPPRWHFRGIDDWTRTDIEALAKLKFLIVYTGTAMEVTARVVDIDNQVVLREVSASGPTFIPTTDALFAELERTTGGSFKKR